MKTKEELRKHFKTIRQAIPDKGKKSEQIARRLFASPAFQNTGVIALYASLPEEVSTDMILAEALKAGKTVCLPKVQGKQLHFFAVQSEKQTASGAFGIREPLSEQLVEKKEIELLIVPLLAADKEHFRLGFGGGFYDRYLSDCSAESIGICFSEQISNHPLPREEHDIATSAVLSEKGFI